ncbi:MAG: DUF928 domain-containing protein [bacterium]
MKKFFIIILLMFICLYVSFHLACASDKQEGYSRRRELHKNAPNENQVKKLDKSISGTFVYKPPKKSKMGSRICSVVRGAGDDVLSLSVLAPDHTGLTTHSQPSFYWYHSGPNAHNIEFTLNDEQGIKPLLEIHCDVADNNRIQCLDLSDYNLHLSPGIHYEWFVAMVPDPEQRAHDIIARGTVECVEPSQELIKRLSEAHELDIPFIYADEGLWYDALSALSKLIALYPNNNDLREKRASLLEQVGLSEVAEYERTR